MGLFTNSIKALFQKAQQITAAWTIGTGGSLTYSPAKTITISLPMIPEYLNDNMKALIVSTSVLSWNAPDSDISAHFSWNIDKYLEDGDIISGFDVWEQVSNAIGMNNQWNLYAVTRSGNTASNKGSVNATLTNTTKQKNSYVFGVGDVTIDKSTYKYILDVSFGSLTGYTYTHYGCNVNVTRSGLKPQ